MPRTTPASSAKLNGVASASGYGSTRLAVNRAAIGIEVRGRSQESSQRAAFYPEKLTSGGFTIGLVFSEWGDYNGFFNWIREYGYKASRPGGGAGVMRIIIPAVGIDRAGVPQGGITYGDSVGANLYGMTIDFEGTDNPVLIDSASIPISRFVLPTAQVEHGQYFYPDGIQLGGQDYGEDTLFDIAENERAVAAAGQAQVQQDIAGVLAGIGLPF